MSQRSRSSHWQPLQAFPHGSPGDRFTPDPHSGRPSWPRSPLVWHSSPATDRSPHFDCAQESSQGKRSSYKNRGSNVWSPLRPHQNWRTNRPRPAQHSPGYECTAALQGAHRPLHSQGSRGGYSRDSEDVCKFYKPSMLQDPWAGLDPASQSLKCSPGIPSPRGTLEYCREDPRYPPTQSQNQRRCFTQVSD